MDLSQYIRDIPDFPKPGIVFKDITPLLSEPKAFKFAVEALTAAFSRDQFDAVAAAEARGFLFAAPLAIATGKPLIPLRKPGKLPYSTHALAYDLEYGTAELQVHTDAIRRGDRVLLIDDLLATGGTMEAACNLVKKTGGTIAGLGFLVELSFLGGRKRFSSHNVRSLITY